MPDPSPPGDGILHCFKCGTTSHCSPDEMLRYSQTHWPTCCDDVMTLFTRADRDNLLKNPPPPPADPPK